MNEYYLPAGNTYYRTNEFKHGRPTLVFVHGLSGSSSAWAEYERFFSEKCNVLSYDLRGHGKSPKPKRYKDYAMEHLVEDLHELLAHLKIEKCIIVSHSFAVLIVLEFLARYQSQVSAVVFLSPSFCVRDMFSSRIAEPFLQLSRLMEPLPFSGKPGAHVDYTRFKNTGDWNIPRMIADVGNTSIRVYLWGSLQTYSVDREAFLSEIEIPVLLMHGKNDTIFPVKNSLIMAQQIKNSKLILLDNMDHIMVLNRFPEVSVAIEKFVNSL